VLPPPPPRVNPNATGFSRLGLTQRGEGGGGDVKVSKCVRLESGRVAVGGGGVVVPRHRARLARASLRREGGGRADEDRFSPERHPPRWDSASTALSGIPPPAQPVPPSQTRRD